MAIRNRAIAQREDEEAQRLFLQFQSACLSLLKKPTTRRGPYIIGDDELKSATRDQERHTKTVLKTPI